jgi:hypothetical protein
MTLLYSISTLTDQSLSQNFSPRLHESHDETGEYAALSHCWGTASMITTTVGTILDRKAAIPWDMLPKTFNEAIIVTHELGL